MRSRPATSTALHVDSCFALVTARRRNDRFGPAALARSASFAEAGCRSVIVDQEILRSRARNLCAGQRPCPAPRSKWGRGRNARATSSRLRAFPECPPAVHPRESPVVAGSAAIIQQAQERSRFSLCPTLRQILAPRNGKRSRSCAETVEDETSLWNTEEN
jgi:hypothetical protein